jgi:hypothetical protein
MSDFALGQRVKFSHVLVRDGRWDDKERVHVRRWDPVDLTESSLVREGVIVGKRTLSNGHVERVTESDGYGGSVYTHSEWWGKHYFRAYMVVETLRTKPVYVLPEHIEAL